MSGRAGAALLSALGALALGVAAFGPCGVVAHTVAQGTQEVGLRIVGRAGRA